MQGFLLIHSDSLLDSEQTFSMGIWMYLAFHYLYINLLSCSCLKPNTVKEPNNFSDDYIMSQLKYTGIMETTRIRQCGFPTRLTFEDFLKRWALSSTLGKTMYHQNQSSGIHLFVHMWMTLGDGRWGVWMPTHLFHSPNYIILCSFSHSTSICCTHLTSLYCTPTLLQLLALAGLL